MYKLTESTLSMNELPLQKIHQLIINLAKSAYSYGVSQNRLEAYLSGVAEALGTHVELMGSSTAANFIFWQGEEAQQQSYFVRLPAVNPNMAKLVQVGELADRLKSGTLSVSEGTERLQTIQTASSPYGVLANALAFFLVGVGVAIIFASFWYDVAIGGVLGLVVFSVTLLATKWGWVGRNVELVSAFVASLLAHGLAVLIPGSNPFVVVICAVGVFIPGFGLTLGLAEIFFQYTLTGLNRIIGAVLVLLKLFAGVVLGAAIAKLFLNIPPTADPVAVAPIIHWFFILLLFVGIVLIFQVRPKDVGWVILGGLLAYAGLKIGEQLGGWQGAFLGAFILGVYANLMSRWLRLPVTVFSLPAVMVLLPGVVAYLSLFNIPSSGTEALVMASWQILQTVAALIIGLLVANGVATPAKTL